MSANADSLAPKLPPGTIVAQPRQRGFLRAHALMARHTLILLVIIIAAYVIGILLFGVGIASAQTATPDFKNIDTVIDAYLPKLQAYEINYLDAKGHGYLQALWSHSAPPADGALVAPDLLISKPTDQAESFFDLWSAVIITDGKVPVRLRIDVYDGPSGKGYVIVVESIIAGSTYTRSINTGSEKWREQDWIEVKPDVEMVK